MGSPDYSSLVARQREYFLSGSTRPAAWRRMSPLDDSRMFDTQLLAQAAGNLPRNQEGLSLYTKLLLSGGRCEGSK
jgi:hypothetical protein